MRGSYCYMPILPARYAAFRAVANLSPLAKARTAPMFDIPNVELKEKDTVDSFLEKRAIQILNCWQLDRPFYVDAYNLPLEWRTAAGNLPLLFLVDCLRARGARLIPVTGTVWDRGAEYVNSVRSDMTLTITWSSFLSKLGKSWKRAGLQSSSPCRSRTISHGYSQIYSSCKRCANGTLRPTTRGWGHARPDAAGAWPRKCRELLRKPNLGTIMPKLGMIAPRGN